MKDLKSVFDFQIRICSDTENMTNVYDWKDSSGSFVE